MEPALNPTDQFNSLVWWLFRFRKDISGLSFWNRIRVTPYYFFAMLSAILVMAGTSAQLVAFFGWRLTSSRFWNIVLGLVSLPITIVFFPLGYLLVVAGVLSLVFVSRYFRTFGVLVPEGIRITNRQAKVTRLIRWDEIGWASEALYFPYRGAHIHPKIGNTVVIHVVEFEKVTKELHSRGIKI